MQLAELLLMCEHPKCTARLNAVALTQADAVSRCAIICMYCYESGHNRRRRTQADQSRQTRRRAFKIQDYLQVIFGGAPLGQFLGVYSLQHGGAAISYYKATR